MTVRFRCPGCGAGLAKDHLKPNKSVRCPKCGQQFLPVAQGLPANKPASRHVPVAAPSPAAPAAPPSSAAGGNVWLAGFLTLFGIVAAAGAVYWVIRNQSKEQQPQGVAQGGGVPGPKEREPRGDAGAEPKPGDRSGPAPEPKDQPGAKPQRRPDAEAFGPPVALTLLDQRADDEPGQRPGPPGVLKGPKGTVQRLVYAPDGTKLSAVYSYTENGGQKTQVVLWDLASQQPTTLLDQGGPGLVFFSPDGKSLITGSDAQVGTYDVATGAGKATFPGEIMAASVNGRTLVTKGQRDKFSIYDVPSGKEVMSFEPTGSKRYHLAVSPDGKRVAFETDQDVRLFDVPAAKEMPRIQASQSQSVVELVLIDATQLFVGLGHFSAGADSMALWDLSARDDKALLRRQAEHPAGGRVSRAVLSPDGKTLALDQEQVVSLWDLAGWKSRASIPCHTPAFSADSKTIAGHDRNGGVVIADAATGRVRTVAARQRTASGGSSWTRFGLSPDGKVLALATEDGVIHLRPLPGGGPAGVKQLASLPFPPNTNTVGGSDNEQLFFTPGGRFVVVPAGVQIDPNTSWDHVAWNLARRKLSAGFHSKNLWTLLDASTAYTADDGDVEVFIDLATGKERQRNKKRGLPYRRLLLSPDGKALATSVTRDAKGQSEQIELLNPANFQVMSVLHKGPASRFAFSADSKLLAAAVPSVIQVKLWDLKSKAEVPTLAHAGTLFAFADKDKWLVTVDLDVLYACEVGAAQTQKKVELPRGHTGKVNAVACSPTAPLFASVGENGEVLLRDLATGDVRVRLPGHTGNVTAVGFTPDGKRLVTAGEDKTLKLWEIGELPQPGEAARPPEPVRPRRSRAFPFQLHKYAEFPCEKLNDKRGYLHFSRDGNVVVAGFNQFRVWDLANKSLKYPTIGGSDPRASGEAWLSQDGRHLMYWITDDMGTTNWLAATDVTTGTVRQEPLSKRFTGALTFSPNGKAVAIGHRSPGEEGKVLTVLDLPSFTQKAALTAFDAGVSGVGYTPDGSNVFAFIQDRDGTRLVRLDPDTLKQRADLGKVQDSSLVFSPDSKLVGFHANQGAALTLWEIATGKVRTELRGGGEHYCFVADRPLLATGNYERLTVWDINTGQARGRIEGLEDVRAAAGNKPLFGTSYDVAFSADRRWLALGADDGLVYFFNLARGKLAAKFKAHLGEVAGLGFSPDGRFLVTIGREKKLKVWYLERW
ncbi:MAG TPA: hypothetical protein VG013_29980 [Gemmataceae bacterium]|jgi:WD40 repeat protein|nr:hypothetical protein [Gemmataceae bacterium]